MNLTETTPIRECVINKKRVPYDVMMESVSMSKFVTVEQAKAYYKDFEYIGSGKKIYINGALFKESSLCYFFRKKEKSIESNVAISPRNVTTGQVEQSGINAVHVKSSGACVATTHNGENRKADAILIADSFNTYNECGKLPSKLLAENKEMSELLEVVVSWMEKHGAKESSNTLFKRAKKVLNNLK